MNFPVIPSIPVGINGFGRLLEPGSLVVIAGHLGHGADTLAANIARNAAVNAGIPTLFTSCWGYKRGMVERLLAAHAVVPLARLESYTPTDDDNARIARTSDRMQSAPLFLNAEDLTITEITRHVEKTRAQLAVVEGAHLLNDEEASENPEHRADIQARMLKRLAMDAKIPVVASVALPSRAGRTTDAVPNLYDFGFRDPYTMPSDAVVLVHRPDLGANGNPVRAGEIDINVAKHRHGLAFETTACFQAEYDRIIGMNRGGES
jgi:replicative DNA helicase